jgi:hypothetical protein
MSTNVTRLFSRQTMSTAPTTPITQPPSPETSPEHSTTASPAGSRSRANSYDMEQFNKLLKHYEETGKIE